MRIYLLLSLLPYFLASCKAIPPGELNKLYKDALDLRDSEYRIKHGDTITIMFFNNATHNQTLLVLPDGRTDPYFMDNYVAAGKSIKQLQDDIKEHYTDQIRDPEISIQISPVGEVIYLEGHVSKPSTQAYSLKMTLSQLLANAGGYRITASADSVILRRPYRNPARPDKFRINLYDESEEIFLLPNDHIIVEPTTWILIRDYLDEYVWGFIAPAFGIARRAGTAAGI